MNKENLQNEQTHADKMIADAIEHLKDLRSTQRWAKNEKRTMRELEDYWAVSIKESN